MNGKCVLCNEMVEGSDICNHLTPANPMNVVYSCSDNYYFTEDLEEGCVSC